MRAVLQREVRAFFTSVTGWLFIAAHVCLAGLYFFAVNLLSGYGNVADTVSGIVFLLLLTTPVLTMRILAEDQKQKTDQLILTAPVSVSGIVMGKYLAMVAVFTVPVAVMALFPVILSAYGSVPMGESYAAILVYYLFGLACISIGMFVSSLTESQIIAAVVTFAILFAAYMMPAITSLISRTGNVLTQILGAFDFSARLEDLLGGTLDFKAVFYFLTVILVFLFLTVQSIQKRRYQLSVRAFRFGAYSSGMIALVCAIAVFANLALSALPDRYTEVDVTQQKLYSLTDTTRNLVQNLEEDVTIYVINSESGQDEMLGDTLEGYRNLSDHIQIVYQDPVVSPNFYQNYADTVTVNSLIVETEKRFRVIDYNDIYETGFNYADYSTTVTGYDAEGLLTSAIAYVTSEEAPVIYALEGHDELTLSETFSDGLKKENADLEELTFLTEEAVPEDACGVLVLAPAQDLTQDDAQKLMDYLDRGGILLMETSYIDRFSEEMPNLSSVLSYFGLSIGDGLVLEQDAERMYQTPVYLLPEVSSDSLTEGVYGSRYDYVMMPYAQPILIEEREDVEVTALLNTSESSWAKAGLESAQDMEQEEGDAQGPFAVGVSAKKTAGETTAQLILYSSEMLFTDAANQYTMDNNLRLFTNAVSAMTGEEESVSIPAKSFETAYVTVPAASAVRLGILLMGVVPAALLAAGIIIWIRRKRRL